MVDLLEQAGRYVSLAAFLGLAFLVPLYLSQRRDVRRLREWSRRSPDAVGEVEAAAVASARAAQQAAIARARGEIAADRAERRARREAAREPATLPAAPSPAPPPATRPAARPVTDRYTLYREPAWRTWLRRGPTTRELLVMMVAVFVVGVAAFVGAREFLGQDADTGGAAQDGRAGGIVRGEVEVAVLNGTAVPGLAARVGDDVEANGYTVGRVSNSESPAEETVVMFEPGHEAEAEAVAHDLGVRRIEPIDAETEALAEGADVVVIAGEDRAQV